MESITMVVGREFDISDFNIVRFDCTSNHSDLKRNLQGTDDSSYWPTC